MLKILVGWSIFLIIGVIVFLGIHLLGPKVFAFGLLGVFLLGIFTAMSYLIGDLILDN